MSSTNGEGDSSSNSSSTSTSSTNSTSNMSHPSGATLPPNTAIPSGGPLTPTVSATANGISLIEEFQQHLDPVAAVAAGSGSANNLAATVSAGAQQRNSPKVQPHYMNQMPNSFQQPHQQNYNQIQHQLLNNLNLNALNHLVNRNDMFSKIF